MRGVVCKTTSWLSPAELDDLRVPFSRSPLETLLSRFELSAGSAWVRPFFPCGIQEGLGSTDPWDAPQHLHQVNGR